MAVADAVWGEHRVRIRYRRWEAPREVVRMLDPYGVVLKGGRWYLVGASDGTPRTYRVSEILELQPLEEKFERPNGFRLGDYWQSYLDEFEARRLKGTARVRLTERGLQRLPDLLGHAAARAARENIMAREDGWVTTIIPIEEVAHAHGDLLRIGTDVVVEEPTELREMITDTVRRLSTHYR
jgi:predicted DNA-binding transcriptional regulator YafY